MYLLNFSNSANEFLKVSHIVEVICAELLIIETDPTGKLIKILTSVILHGPYGKINPNSLYMSNAQDDLPRCTKQYPHNFFKETSIQENGYLLYWWRNNSSMNEISHPQDRNLKFTIDNCWVVPYNPYLTCHVKAYINVEICGSIQTIQYIHN